MNLNRFHVQVHQTTVLKVGIRPAWITDTNTRGPCFRIQTFVSYRFQRLCSATSWPFFLLCLYLILRHHKINFLCSSLTNCVCSIEADSSTILFHFSHLLHIYMPIRLSMYDLLFTHNFATFSDSSNCWNKCNGITDICTFHYHGVRMETRVCLLRCHWPWVSQRYDERTVAYRNMNNHRLTSANCC